MNEFRTYHPIVNFLYFVFVIGFGCFFVHPLYLGIWFVSGFVYSIVLNSKNSIAKNLIYMLPMIIIMALINPLFNHRGITVIGYFPNGNPLTLESVLYGVVTSVMIAGVICHFSSYNRVMTSDKFIYLFGKVIPSLSLIFSMTLRFVPRFSSQLKVVANAQKCMGRDVSKGGMIKRARNGLNILSVMTTWALENAIDTADSMKSRGYGIPGRTAFSLFRFDKRDCVALVWIVFLAMYTLAGSLMGVTDFEYFPCMKRAEVSVYSITVFVSYLLLCIYPLTIEIREVIRWKFLKSKI